MKIIFIIAYYGEYPSYFQLFLNSCKNNPNYEWLIVTDNKTSYNYPKNVHILDLSWLELCQLFQNKFSFKISIDRPYKLCDFKPAYGYIFQEYICNYDYWGHCDVDLVFGNLDHFLPPDKICNYDKIGHLGHMSLYKNTKEINMLFMQQTDNCYRYEEVFSDNKICIFDEWNSISINHIFLKKRKKIWFFDEFFDIYPYDDNFKRVHRKIPKIDESYGVDVINKKPSFASIENGSTYCWSRKNKTWYKSEVAYIHFQKRDMKMNKKLVDMNNILCVPNDFISLSNDIIPKKYITYKNIHQLINKRKLKKNLSGMIYFVASNTSGIRHPIRNFKMRKRGLNND